MPIVISTSDKMVSGMSNHSNDFVYMQDNPCMHCGACCAYFRVSFYWAEMVSGGGVVPDELTEPLTPFLSCMKGTNSKNHVVISFLVRLVSV